MIQKLKRKAGELKKNLKAISYAMQDPELPIFPRFLGFFILAYALSPVDLIPDFIPVIGYLDDLILLPLLIMLLIKLIPVDILDRAKVRALEDTEYMKKNWFMGSLIILVWILLVIWLVWHFTDVF